MPKCKLCGQKKEFYNELGYCDDCLEEVRAFLKTSKQRLCAWKEESLTAGEERRAEIAAQALALEDALRQYGKHGVVWNQKEYRALLRAIYAHCGVTRPGKRKQPLFLATSLIGAVCLVAAVVFAVQWQAVKAECEDLRIQNEQLSLSLSDLQMQLDGMQTAPQGDGGDAVSPDGTMDGAAVPSMETDGVMNGAVAQDGAVAVLE